MPFEFFLDSVKSNLFTLKKNLDELGYRFERAEPIRLAGCRDEQELEDIEARFGSLPALYRAWYLVFHEIDFSQEKSQLFSNIANDVAGLGLNQSLIFLEIRRAVKMRDELAAEGVRVEMQNDRSVSKLIPTGAIASNCEPKGVWLPNSISDPVLYNEGGGDVTFETEIRDIIAYGGFPFWARMAQRRPPATVLKHCPDWERIYPLLSRGIEPIPKSGR